MRYMSCHTGQCFKMNKYIVNITVILLAILDLLGNCNCQENAQFTLSPSLLECYNGTGLNNKENLLPMTLSTFLDILRKVETSQDGQNMNINQLGTSMLHRFKSDGIERRPNVLEGEGVIPYSVTGVQAFYNRLLLIWLIPANNYRFPNESLTAIERCTLHFMLSKSYERYSRGDEGTTCSRLSSFTYEDEYSRFKRSVNTSDELEIPANTDLFQLNASSKPEEVVEPTEVNSLILDSLLGSSTLLTANEANNNTTTETGQTNADVDILNSGKTTNDTKGNMFLDPNEDFRQQQSGKYVDAIDHKESEDIHEEVAVQADDQNPVGTRSISSSNAQLSSCPVENGVIYTDYGAISISAVLNGIVTGLEPQTVNLQHLSGRTAKEKLITDAVSANAAPVDNRWASTIAGDLAEVTLYKGPLGSMGVGATGGWNNTNIPRWYFLNNQEETYMSDADIRGGLDGLIIARAIQTWYQRTSQQIRLSEIFDMYYSETGLFQARACRRKIDMDISGSDLEQQTASFASALDANSITVATLTFNTINNYSVAASSLLRSYIASTLTSPTCSIARNVNASVNAALDLIVVLDTQWSYDTAKSIIRLLAESIEVGIYNSNITVLTGQSQTPLLNSTNSINTLSMNFTSQNYTLFPTGFNLRSNLEATIPNLLRNKMEEDRSRNVAGGRSTSVLFIPNTGYSISDTDLQASIETYRNIFRLRIPDAHFFYAVSNRDRFQNLVQDYNRDIFTLTTSGGDSAIRSSVQAIASRLVRVHQRIINPYCGSDWEARSYTTAQFTAALRPGSVNYYRLHQNYFYSSSNAKLKIQGSGSGSLRVCSSRHVEYPNNATSTGNSDIQCKVINSDIYEISLSSACEDDLISLCLPLYLSIEATDAEPTTFNCRDRNICRFIGNVQYTVSHEGLTCASGAGKMFFNYSLISITTIVIFVKTLIAS